MDSINKLENDFFRIPGFMGTGKEDDLYPTFHTFVRDTHENRLKDIKYNLYKFNDIEHQLNVYIANKFS